MGKVWILCHRDKNADTAVTRTKAKDGERHSEKEEESKSQCIGDVGRPEPSQTEEL